MGYSKKLVRSRDHARHGVSRFALGVIEYKTGACFPASTVSKYGEKKAGVDAHFALEAPPQPQGRELGRRGGLNGDRACMCAGAGISQTAAGGDRSDPAAHAAGCPV